MMTDERADKIATEMVRLQEAEAHKRMLYDRTIGGSMVPRPSDDFIRQNIGTLKNEKQLRQEATDRVDAQLDKEAQQSQEKQEFDHSVREHNARIEREDSQTRRADEVNKISHSNRDQMRQRREDITARDRLRGDDRNDHTQHRGKPGHSRGDGVDR